MLRIQGRHFVDEFNRRIILRGVNLAGISIPASPDGASHLKKDWPPRDLRNVSWLGRPFPLEEADEHFSRLRDWGFNCIRMLTSWEAIEHAGPYQYDTAYLDYLEKLVRIAGEYGFYVFINMHQDVWSRVTGGDGHPLWLFEKVGLDYSKFDLADAAINMQYLWDPDPQKNRYSQQSWFENTKLFPVRTMWTLFWAGADFTPNLRVSDDRLGHEINIGEYMQQHFIMAVEQIATRVKDQGHVFGFNPINEPSFGFIGLPIGSRPLIFQKTGSTHGAEPGIAWSVLDNMLTAAGLTRTIEVLDLDLLKGGLKVGGTRIVNPQQVSIWLDGREDFWIKHGVWSLENSQPKVGRENYFQKVGDHPVNFTHDYLIPFHQRVADVVRRYNSNWLLLVENDPVLNSSIRWYPWPTQMPSNTVNASHWYDIIQLQTKRFFWPLTLDITTLHPVWGWRGIQAMYKRFLLQHVKASEQINQGNCPTLIGEFGIAMDMDKKKAYRKWDSSGIKAFHRHDQILNTMYNALDDLLLSSTHWNYVSFNRNEFGDYWNLEDLSIYSKDQIQVQGTPKIPDKYQGSRGIFGFCRPYAIYIGGDPQKAQFNWHTRNFLLEYTPDPHSSAPTEIFIPRLYYPRGVIVECNRGRVEINEKTQRVFIFPEQDFSPEIIMVQIFGK